MKIKFDSKYILSLLKDKMKHLVCPICGKNKFSLVGGFMNHKISNYLDMSDQPEEITTVATCCKNCGYMNFHAYAVLEFNRTIDDTDNPQPLTDSGD